MNDIFYQVMIRLKSMLSTRRQITTLPLRKDYLVVVFELFPLCSHSNVYYKTTMRLTEPPIRSYDCFYQRICFSVGEKRL